MSTRNTVASRMTLANVRKGVIESPLRVLLYGAEGIGKAQPLDRGVLTPTGFRSIGSLAPGDTICAPDGGTQTVVAVHPRGVLPVFRVATSDGAETVCCGDHLWTVTDVQGRTTTLSTSAIAVDLTERHGKWPAYKHRLPIVRPVALEPVDDLLVDPYVLGLLLGDGGLLGSTAMFHKPERDLWAAIEQRLPRGDSISVHDEDGRSPRISIVRRKSNDPSATMAALRKMGLAGTSSTTKFVPSEYLVASPAARLELLRGLIDTDGSVRKGGRSVEFSTASPHLADAVTHLVRSLGGICKTTTRTPAYWSHGEKRSGALSFRQSIWFPDDTVPVASEKNLARWESAPRAATYRTIRSVDPAGEEECVCITVSNADGLYITDDFIVTHNSSFAAGAPSPIFLCAENGTMHLDVARLPEPASWEEAMQALSLLETEPHDYESLVVDTINWLEPLCWHRVTGGKCTIEEYARGYGKGYLAALDHWRMFIRGLEQLWSKRRMHIILLAHAQVKGFADPMGTGYDRFELAMHGKAAGAFKQWVDFVLYAREEAFAKVDDTGRAKGRSTGARFIHAQPDAAYDAKSRSRYPMPKQIPLGWQPFIDAVKSGVQQRDELLKQIDAGLAELADPEVEKKVRGYLTDPHVDVAEIANAVAAKVQAKKETSDA